MDQGGELYSNSDILNVFTNHHYEVHPTWTNSSHQNEPLEGDHYVIGDHVCALWLVLTLISSCGSMHFSTTSVFKM